MSSYERLPGYLYPNSNVLINKQNLRTNEELDAYERAETSFRALEIELKPIQGKFDFEHLKSIHKHLFQNVYDWAGQPREVTIAKGGTVFCPHPDLERHANYIFSELKRDNYLRSSSHEQFVEKAAKYYNEINYGHYFREGNGRSGRMFFSELARDAGYDIQWERMDVTRYYTAVIEASKGNKLESLRSLIKDYSVPLQRELDLDVNLPSIKNLQNQIDSVWKDIQITNTKSNYLLEKEPDHPQIKVYTEQLSKLHDKVNILLEQIDKCLESGLNDRERIEDRER